MPSLHRLTNWALALLIVLIYVGMFALDGPSDIDTEKAVAADKADAIQTAQVAP
jgi:hypothetical protein